MSQTYSIVFNLYLSNFSAKFQQRKLLIPFASCFLPSEIASLALLFRLASWTFEWWFRTLSSRMGSRYFLVGAWLWKNIFEGIEATYVLRLSDHQLETCQVRWKAQHSLKGIRLKPLSDNVSRVFEERQSIFDYWCLS